MKQTEDKNVNSENEVEGERERERERERDRERERQRERETGNTISLYSYFSILRGKSYLDKMISLEMRVSKEQIRRGC